MTIMSKRVLLTVVFCWVTILGCSKIDPDTPKEYFTQWNSCTALTALQEYVQDVTNPSSANYIKPEDRIATFDMDGTFVGELYPTYFEYNLLEYLEANGFTYDVVSGSDRFICRTLVESIGIAPNRVIGKVPVLSFGNSSGDSAMHNYCLSNSLKSAAFMLVADDDARDHADLAEGARREAKWREAGYIVISMKNDFKTIYGPGVKKVDFTF